MTGPEVCPSCTTPGRYCAPNRCYCGHPACPAYASWVDVRDTTTDPAWEDL